MYVLRFCRRYASEIYQIFKQLMPVLNTDDLIYSIGCGSCLETIGIEKYCRENSITLNYFGNDCNAIWQEVADKCCIASQNLISHKSFGKANGDVLSNVKILLLNYMLSDYKNHNPSLTYFLQNNLAQYLSSMPSDSFVVINDQNHGNEWEDEFDEWAETLDTTLYDVKNYFFDPFQKKCNPRGKRIPSNVFVFSNQGLDVEIENYFQENLNCCESAVTIIHKR